MRRSEDFVLLLELSPEFLDLRGGPSVRERDGRMIRKIRNQRNSSSLSRFRCAESHSATLPALEAESVPRKPTADDKPTAE